MSADMSARPCWNLAYARQAQSLIEKHKLSVIEITVKEGMSISDIIYHKWFESCKYGLNKRPNVLEFITTRDS